MLSGFGVDLSFENQCTESMTSGLCRWKFLGENVKLASLGSLWHPIAATQTRVEHPTNQDPKKSIKIKNLSRNPPSQPPPPAAKGTPDPANSLCWGLFSLQNTGKRPT